MVTITDAQRFRLLTNIGDDPDDPALTDDEITNLFTEAEEAGYTDGKVIIAFVTMRAVEWLIAKASTDVSYTQNATSESASDRFKNLEKLLARWENKFEQAMRETEGGMMMWGSPRKKPVRIEEYPDA